MLRVSRRDRRGYAGSVLALGCAMKTGCGFDVIVGDVAEVCRSFVADTFDGVLCDPPYGLKFMGKEWDHGVPSSDTWREVLRVLKPGAHVLAFGGTRTYHRLVCGIEDAGFEVRDQLAWMFGTGFPKSLNVGSGFGTALKPAHEPIVLARKMIEGNVAANVSAYGTGVLSIDACRVTRADNDVSGWSKSGSGNSDNVAMSGRNYARDAKPDAKGRWPANVIVDEEAASQLDMMFGERKSTLSGRADPNVSHKNIGDNRGTSWFGGGNSRVYADEGGASRFFYCPKASKRERGEGNVHPTVKPIALTEYLAKLIRPTSERPRMLVPFSGSGSEMIGAIRAGWETIGIEQSEEYAAIARKRIEAMRDE